MRRAAAALLLAGATACGTTVPAAQQANVSSGDGLGQAGAPTTSAPLAAGGSTGSVQTAVGGSAGGGPGGDVGSATGGATGTTAVPSPGGAIAAVPRGGSVVVGFETHKDSATAIAAVGISGASTGDTANQMKALADALNKRGGILGRKVVLAAHDVNTLAKASNPDQSDAASCSDWIEKKAFVVVDVTPRPSLRTCLGKAGIPIISSLSISSPASVYGDVLPGVYAPSAMSIDRSVRAVIDRLVARGFFTGWDTATGRPSKAPVKIGMQSFDDADGRHVVDVTRAALAAHGLALAEVEAHSTDVSQNSSSTSAAVLRFRANGITHVIDANLIFFQTADSQGYHPRYVVQDTINTPALLAQNVSASQLHGSMGAGYLPLYEVNDPPVVSAEGTRCRALMTSAGEDVSQPLALAFMFQECDAMSFLEKALTTAGTVSAAGLRAGAQRATSFVSALTYGSHVTAARRDGADRVRDFAYVDGCSCFRFSSSATYPVP